MVLDKLSTMPQYERGVETMTQGFGKFADHIVNLDRRKALHI